MRVPEVLRAEPQFRLLFGSQVLSIIGDRVTMVVLPFAVLAAHGGVADVAYVSMAQFLPYLLLALPAGVWADRHDRKRILIASDAVRLATQLTAALLLLTGHARVEHLLVLTAIYGGADAFFAPAFTALTPLTLAAPANLQPANALRGLTFSLGSVLGPALAGLLVALTGDPGGALLFDAATFLVSVVLLLPVRPRLVERELHEEVPDHFWANLTEGWREVRSRRWLLSFLGAMSTYHLVVLPAIFVIGPVLFEREYGGATHWAWVTLGFGAGCILGDLVMLRWRPRFALRVAGIALLGASTQAAIIGSGWGTAAIALLETGTGVCVTMAFTLWETTLQEHVPDRALSRVSSYDYLASAGVIPLGTLLGGLASAAIGIHGTLVLMTVIAMPIIAVIAAGRQGRMLPRGTALEAERV